MVIGNSVKLIRGHFLAKTLSQSVVTIGNFDGLHKGHQALIDRLKMLSKQKACPSVILTFRPHPRAFFAKNQLLPSVMRFREKWETINQLGVDILAIARFNHKIASLSPEAFVKEVLVDALGVKAVVVGDDFRFGAKRAGDISVLEALGVQYGFEVVAMPQTMHAGKRISSSRVREALYSGDFELNRLLTNRPYQVSGHVAYGSQMGRRLGYPTANIFVDRKKPPLTGIFVVQVRGLGDTVIPGVASVGYRPTFGGKQLLLEVHLFDFDQTIYGALITVEFLKKIRDELQFDRVEDLIHQMDHDAEIARDFFK